MRYVGTFDCAERYKVSPSRRCCMHILYPEAVKRRVTPPQSCTARKIPFSRRLGHAHACIRHRVIRIIVFIYLITLYTNHRPPFPLPLLSASLITFSASPKASLPTLQLLNTTPCSLIISSAFAHLCLHICSLLFTYWPPSPPPFMPSVEPVLVRLIPCRGDDVEYGCDVCADVTCGREW